MIPTPWPFDHPPGTGVLTQRQIIAQCAPILHVSHDLADHGWQFLGWDDARIEDAMLVSFSRIVNLDATLLQLADLPPGWHAWRRTIADAWERTPDSEWEGNG